MTAREEAVERVVRGLREAVDGLADLLREETGAESDAAGDPARDALRGEPLRRTFRDWVVALGPDRPFEKSDVRAALGVSGDTARTLIQWATGRGLVAPAGTRPARGGAGGRPAILHAYQAPKRAGGPRPREGGGNGAGRDPVPGTGRAKKASPRKEIRALIERAKDRGFEVVTGGDHPQVYLNGRWVTSLPTTPSDHRGMDNAKAMMSAALRNGPTEGGS